MYSNKFKTENKLGLSQYIYILELGERNLQLFVL